LRGIFKHVSGHCCTLRHGQSKRAPLKKKMLNSNLEIRLLRFSN
jgi:hypothetical protein